MRDRKTNEYVWFAVVDERTCDRCLALHGRRFSGPSKRLAALVDGLPAPPLPACRNADDGGCRCTLQLVREGSKSASHLARYPSNWHEIAERVKRLAGYECEHCHSPSVPGRILTVHHIDGDPGNNADDNLVALCQVCHLHFQAKHDPRQMFLLDREEPEWVKRRRGDQG
jgi:hypothetical protein